MKLGTTTFGFRYLLLDPARAPSLLSVVEKAPSYGLATLQICENARPMDLDESQWTEVVQRAKDVGIEIQLGCKTTALDVFRPYLERAAVLPDRLLRIVLEEEEGHAPTRSDVDRFLAGAWPLVAPTGVRLAIENHFHVASSVLAEAVAPYPAERIGFCVDTANSLRNFESPEAVMDLLGDRAFCHHVKDFRVDGDNIGFRVSGAPLGEGRMDLDGILDRIFANNPEPEILVENWVPATGVWETDVYEDEAWLSRGLSVLKARLGVAGRMDSKVEESPYVLDSD